LTLLRVIIYRNLRASQRTGLAYYSILAGCLKILLAIFLLTVFWPTCPKICHCTFTSFYPPVALLIGVLWVVRGVKDASLLVNQDDTTAVGEAVAFATIPTSDEEDEPGMDLKELPVAVAVSSPV
jgi:hypothetical protein